MLACLGIWGKFQQVLDQKKNKRISSWRGKLVGASMRNDGSLPASVIQTDLFVWLLSGWWESDSLTFWILADNLRPIHGCLWFFFSFFLSQLPQTFDFPALSATFNRWPWSTTASSWNKSWIESSLLLIFHLETTLGPSPSPDGEKKQANLCSKGLVSRGRPRRWRRETPQDGTSKPHRVSAAFDRTSSGRRDVYIPPADLESLVPTTLTPPHPNPDPKPRPLHTVLPDAGMMSGWSDGCDLWEASLNVSPDWSFVTPPSGWQLRVIFTVDRPDLMVVLWPRGLSFCTWRSRQLLSGFNINLIISTVLILKDKLEATCDSVEQPKVLSKTHTCDSKVSLDSKKTD